MTHSAIFPNETTFAQSYNNGHNQICWTVLPGDLETPISTYLKTCQNKANSFLLESIEGGQTLGRYSIMGGDPDLLWTYERGAPHASLSNLTSGETTSFDAPLASLKDLLHASKITAPLPEGFPPMAASGLFGYMGYEMIGLAEKLSFTNPDPLGIPSARLMRPRHLIIHDNVKNKLFLIAPIYPQEGVTVQQAYQSAQTRLQDLSDALAAPLPNEHLNYKTALSAPLDVSSNTTENDYKAIVEKAKDYIFEGDIFQVVPGQRFSVDFDLPPLAFYRSLRVMNPSPFMVYMTFADATLVASSPEIMVRVRDNTVTVRPIAGTRPRGKTADEDKALAEDLLADEKECAEHLMLVDLARNDVGKVSAPGSVKVTDYYAIENYSHVMHIASNIEGTLRGDLDIIDAHFSGFPAGTVSGAPKIRAMEIIEELEKEARSFYAGSIGYFSANGMMDTCIALRTGLIKDSKLYVQAGAGIVADSAPQAEYDETVNKAKALINAANEAITAAEKA